MNDTFVSLCRKLFVVCILLLNTIFVFAQPCECTNCPLPITDNGSFDGFLDVTVNGADDLGQCPLEQVCFTIDHTWIGDLSVSLTSPSGLNYLIMADANNASGGCGTNEDDIDVCIEIGSGSPLTGGTEYICNNGGGGPCLIGNWNVPCNVTDPFGGADPAPNCDLNDFNIPGDPANGTWSLTINDVCSQDVGQLITWSLVFGCGVIDCILCEADAGALNQPDVASCQFDPSLNLTVIPDYGGGFPPSATEYGYAYVVTDVNTGIIFDIQNNSSFSSLPVGDYTICGLSYAFVDAAIYPTYIGQDYSNLEADLALLDPVFCGDLSSNCFALTVGSIPTPGMETFDLCIGDCLDYNNVQYCNPGLYPVMLTSYLGCDSLVNLMINPLSDSNVFIEGIVCPGETMEVGGVEYPVGNHYLDDVAFNGCDSTTTIIISEFYVNASTSVPPEITCTNPSVILTSAGSFGSSFLWYDENGNEISTYPAVEVFSGGCYDLVVSRDSIGITCSDTATICVVENIADTEIPTVTGPTEICFGDTISYQSSIIPDYLDYTWTLPPGVEVINGGDGFPIVNVVWNSPVPGQVCVVAEGTCGPSLPGCLDVNFAIALNPPVIDGINQLCPQDTTEYYASLTDNDGFIWSIIGDGNILNGVDSDTVTVVWNSPGIGQICASGLSDCGQGPLTCFPVLINDVPQAPDVTGPVEFCDLDTLSFNVQSSDPLTIGFDWVIPACASIVGGNGMDSISLLMNVSCDSLDICVTAVGECGIGDTDCITVVQTPDIVADSIFGSQDLCLNETASYQVPVHPDALGYNWTVIGGSIVSGQDSNEVEINWTDAGNGSVCLQLFGTCNIDSSQCMDVYVLPEIDSLEVIGADIVCDSSLVDYSVLNPDTLINTFVWSTTCGSIISGQGTSSIEIDWTGCPTGGQICVYGQGTCSDSPELCFDVTGGSVPGQPTITGNTDSCVDITEAYCGASTDASLYNWTVTGGSIVNNASSDCVDVLWEQSGVGQICLVTENGCGSSAQSCLDINLGDAPPVPDIIGSMFSCIDESQNYSYTIGASNIISVEWSIPSACGVINGSNTDSSIDVFWSTSGDCDICIRVENDCGFGPWLCETVTIQALPNPSVGSDDEVCGLSYTFGSTVGTGSLSWSGQGPASIVFSDPTVPNPQVDVSIPGLYSFILEEDIAGCIASDTLKVQFNEVPVADPTVTYSCDGTGDNYQFSFEMIAGNGPFTVSGVNGTWSGQVFTSEFIPSSSVYDLEVYDAEGCGPVIITGSHACPCISEVGQFLDTTFVLCADESIDLGSPSGMVLDANDILSYIITSGAPDPSDLSAGLVVQQTGSTIAFLPGMILSETYYISAVVGDVLIGLTDLQDDCISVSSSVEFSFNPLPEFAFGASDISVCEGDAIVVTANLQNANCADVILDLGNGIQQEFLCVSDGDLLNLPISNPGSFNVTVVSLINENSCSNTSASSFSVNIEDYESVDIESAASVCNSTETGMTTQINLANYITNSTSPDLIWTDITGCSFTGVLPNIDLTGVTPGQYLFSCEVDPATAACISAPQLITLTVEDCDCPELDVNLPGDLCNSNAELNLDDLVIDNTVQVDWSIIADPGTIGYDPALLAGGMLTLTGAAPGVYELQLDYTAPAPVGCILSNSLQVQLSDQLTAGNSLGILEFCFESGGEVDLNALLDANDLGGVWTEVSTIPSSGGSFSDVNGTFDVQSQDVGFYSFRYSVDSQAPCLDDEEDVFIRINANPDVSIDNDGPLTCTNLSAELSTSPSVSYEYQWLFGGMLISEDNSVVVDQGGAYELIVTDALTFCESKGSVFLDSYQEIPELTLEIEDVICHNQATGMVNITNTEGGEGPYLYALNGGDFGADTNWENLVAGSYQVEVEDINGCVGSETVNLINPEPLDISVDLDYSVFKSGFIGVGDSILIDAQVNTNIDNIESISWTPAYLFDCDTCLTVYAYPEFTTSISLEVEAGGCSTLENLQLLVRKDYDIFVPNAVSANDDGLNDIFFIQGSDKVEQITDFEIFDRWGSLLYQYSGFLPNNEQDGWDGRLNGKAVNPGVYVYKFDVKFIDGKVKQYKGSFSLVR